jgi:hypothetical protein
MGAYSHQLNNTLTELVFNIKERGKKKQERVDGVVDERKRKV